MERKVASFFLVGLLALAGLRFYSHYNTLRLIDSDRWAAHSAAVRVQVHSMLSAVEAARVASRDLLIRPDARTSRAYAEARRNVGERIEELGARATTRPARVRDVEELRGLVGAELAALDSATAAPAPSLPAAALIDDPLVAAIREAAARVEAEETNLVEGHLAEARARARREFWVTVVSTALTVAVLGVGYWLLLRHFAARREAGARIESLNEMLRRKVEELQSLLDVMPVGVLISEDPEAKVVRGNAQMARLLNVPPGSNLSLSSPPDGRPAYRAFRDGRELAPAELPLEAAARGEPVSDAELEVVLDGRAVRLCSNAVPLRDKAGRTRGAVAAFWDASAFVAREEQLMQERDAADAAAAATEDLVATVSHDLRTPLHAVKLLTTALREAPREPDETRDTAEQILRLCGAQARLINDVLDLTRISHGRLTVERRPVRLAEVVRSACDTVRLVAEAAQVRLELSVEDPDALVRADAARLQQVFWNLLSNAIKFTRRGGRIAVTLGRAEHRVEVRVADTGVGIDPGDLPHLFDRFWKGERPDRLNRTGLGLGLAIARHIVELHDGTIEADSEGKGRGSTFSVGLPVYDPEDGEPAADAVSLGAGNFDHELFRGTDVEGPG